MAEIQPEYELKLLADGIVGAGLTGILASGNLSTMSYIHREVTCTSKGTQLEFTAPGNAVRVKLDESFGIKSWSSRGGSTFKPTTELESLHLPFYQQSWHPSYVAHLHSPWITTASQLAKLGHLPVVHYYQVLFGQAAVPFVPFKMPGSADLRDAVHKQLSRFHNSEPCRALMLANHGAVVASHSLLSLVRLCIILEDICRMVVQIGAYGTISLVPDDLIPMLREDMESYFAS